MPKLTKKAIRHGRTDGPTLIIEKNAIPQLICIRDWGYWFSGYKNKIYKDGDIHN